MISPVGRSFQVCAVALCSHASVGKALLSTSSSLSPPLPPWYILCGFCAIPDASAFENWKNWDALAFGISFRNFISSFCSTTGTEATVSWTWPLNDPWHIAGVKSFSEGESPEQVFYLSSSNVQTSGSAFLPMALHHILSFGQKHNLLQCSQTNISPNEQPLLEISLVSLLYISWPGWFWNPLTLPQPIFAYLLNTGFSWLFYLCCLFGIFLQNI